VEREKLDLLLEAAQRAPSSKGNNPWEVHRVTDKARIRDLSVAKAHGPPSLPERRW
jgi:nitroreductase